jgi:hypothetical protein
VRKNSRSDSRLGYQAQGVTTMLSTEKITNAFNAICEEAEKMKDQDVPDEVKAGLATIISIAKHQSDIRGSAKGSCSAHAGK